MRAPQRGPGRGLFLLLLALSALPAAAQILPGPYSGWIDFPGSAREALALRVVPGGGGLLDLPSRDIYGYPLDEFAIRGRRLAFSLGSDPDTALRFEARSSLDENMTVLEGSFHQGGKSGRFYLLALAESSEGGQGLKVPVRGGLLRGSLLLPEGRGPFPLAILLSGAGGTDRDGNNYAVPGRNDSLKALALSLRKAGVASFRYDRRGSGESYLLGRREEELFFYDHIEDARAVLGLFTADPRFTRLVLVGHGEGALVAAAALNEEARESGLTPAAGLVLLGASAESALEALKLALEATPKGLKAEEGAIMASLAAGFVYPRPSEYFADFFRPSFQPYLSSWLRYDLKNELAELPVPLLFIHGGRDLQVKVEDYLRLIALRPEAPALFLPGMNHVLKSVGPDPEENFRAFSEPAFPLAEGLGAGIAAFAAGEELPAGLPRVDGGGGSARSPRGLIESR